jgi:Asp-tRNA(Asn)/Glu-tRNA(Gln) amidotransferase C subunit
MQNEFEMSLLRELSFFLGLQIHQSNQGIFISQTKYIREMLKRFGMEDCKPVTTPMQTSCKLRKDDDSKSTDQRQIQVNDWQLTICDNIQTRCNAGSWTSGMISSSTKGNTCRSSEEDFQISQRNKRVWIMVSKRKGSITYCLHRCRLGRLH